MKRKLTLVLATAVAACAVLLSSCAYNPAGSTTENAATFWNSSTTQAFLAQLQKRAGEIINGFLANVGASRSSESMVDKTFRQLKLENPYVPDAILRGVAEQAAR